MVEAASLTLAQQATSPGLARRFVRDRVADLTPDRLQELLILVSELVTNSVRYGRPEIVLKLELAENSIRVSVTDEGSELPVMASESTTRAGDTNGRGLVIVDAVATSWGIEPMIGTTGKAVWFEVGRGN